MAESELQIQRGGIAMPIVKVRTNRQVTIPKAIFDELGLKEGDFVEVSLQEGRILITPKRLVDPEDTLSPEEERLVEKGFEELKKGEYVTWQELKHELDL
jgi:AbrB family looped-hinge helix DNA binding protein